MIDYQVIIFSAHEPDKNSGGLSMIPSIIKLMNKTYGKSIVYFYINFIRPFLNEDERFIEMNKYEEEFLPIVKPHMLLNKNNIIVLTECVSNIYGFNHVVRFNFYFNVFYLDHQI